MKYKKYEIQSDLISANIIKLYNEYRGLINETEHINLSLGLIFMKLLTENICYREEYYLDRELNEYSNYSFRDNSNYYEVFWWLDRSLDNFLSISNNEIRECLNYIRNLLFNVGVHRNELNSYLQKLLNLLGLLDVDKDITCREISQIFRGVITRLQERIDLYNTFTPESITSLIAGIIKSDYQLIENMYNPNYGIGNISFGITDVTSVGKIDANEINYSIFMMAKMASILAIEQNRISIHNRSFIDDSNVKSDYDVIVAHPPFNQRINNAFEYNVNIGKTIESAIINQSLNLLNDNGRAYILVTSGVLFKTGHEMELRKRLILENKLEVIIALPTSIFKSTNVQSYILVIRKNKVDSNVMYINAMDECVKKGIKTSIDDDNINNILENYTLKCSNSNLKFISTKSIVENGFNLTVGKYFDLIGLEELMKEYNYQKYSFEDISKIETYKGEYKPDIVLLNRRTLKAVIPDTSIKYNHNDFIVIQPNEEIIILKYLEYFLNTHIFKSLLNSIRNGVMPNININELKKLEIPIPDKESQNDISDYQSEIDGIICELEEYKNNIINNPKFINDIRYKMDEFRSAIETTNHIDQLKREIYKGEGIHTEFKANYIECEDKIIKALYAFMNTAGGKIFIGVDDYGKIIGVDNDDLISEDDLILNFKNRFRDKVSAYIRNIDAELVNIDNKKIIVVTCKKSDFPVVKNNNGKSEFYVRKNRSSEKINDLDEVIKYVFENFNFTNKFI